MTLDFFPGWLLVLIAAVFAWGGFVKGVIGLGLPTLVMGVLSVAMPAAEAAALLVVPALLTNVWQIGGPGLVALLRRLAPMLLGVCAGVWAGADWLARSGPAGWPTAGLGAALMLYAVLGLLQWRPRVQPRHEVWWSMPIGLATGLVTAATGVFVLPAVPYLHALGLQRDELIRALGLSFLVATLALGVALGTHGVLAPRLAAVSLLALAPALLGMWVGQIVRRRVAPEPFRRVFLLGLLALGLYLLLRVVLMR